MYKMGLDILFGGILGKMLCKSLIIKVFQRSEGLNFTNGTWNRKIEFRKSLFCIYILYYIIIIYRGCSSVPALFG